MSDRQVTPFLVNLHRKYTPAQAARMSAEDLFLRRMRSGRLTVADRFLLPYVKAGLSLDDAKAARKVSVARTQHQTMLDNLSHGQTVVKDGPGSVKGTHIRLVPGAILGLRAAGIR